jgi:hypothetical protein
MIFPLRYSKYSTYLLTHLIGMGAVAAPWMTGTAQSSPGNGATGTISANLPVYNVSSYGASGSANTGYCSGVAGSSVLGSCTTDNNDFSPGQGIVVFGGGIPAKTSPITQTPNVAKEGRVSGSHTYCYVVDTVDPLEGISAPSPEACVSGEPDLSISGTWNVLTTTTSSVGPSPAFLWYVSEDSGPYQLVSIAAFSSATQDVGQRPGTRGGWPNDLPAGNPNIARNEDFFTSIATVTPDGVTTADPLPNTFRGAEVSHDDTLAVQNTINAAVAAGGGIVQFGTGSYVIRRPVFVEGGVSYPADSTALTSDPFWADYHYLAIPNGSSGRIHLRGAGAGTIVSTAPDHGGAASLLAAGYFQRPDDTVGGVLPINQVTKGQTQVVLGGSASALSPGDDVWLYSGSFTGNPCQATSGTAGECHFSELNTVAAVNGGKVTLAYPASKTYRDDGSSAFGMVKLPVTPHDIAVEDMTIDTYNPVISTGMVYGLLVSDVSINGSMTHGAFGGGLKRDVTIENSTWTIGTGDASYGATDEYDQFTNVLFTGDTVNGYAAPGAEALSVAARIYGTEGSSQFTFKNNVFNNVSVYFDETTDDVVSNNQFNNGAVILGSAYGVIPFSFGPDHDAAFVSFASQVSADIDNNTFNGQTPYSPPFIVRLGHFALGTVANNTINYAGNQTAFPGITSYGGAITGNTMAISNPQGSVGIAVIPDQSSTIPAASFNVQDNTVSQVGGVSLAVYVTDPGFLDTAPICIQANNLLPQIGLPLFEAAPGSINLSCSL